MKDELKAFSGSRFRKGSKFNGSRLASLKRRGVLVQGWWLVKLVYSNNCEPGTVIPEPL